MTKEQIEALITSIEDNAKNRAKKVRDTLYEMLDFSDERVKTVTGLNTDNTDPLNPIIQIEVDNVTITGDGTVGSPLVAVNTSALTSQNTIIANSVNTGNPTADAITNGTELKAAILAADLLNIGTRSATNRVAVLLTGGVYDANGTGFTLPSFIDIVGISSSPTNTVLINSSGSFTIIAPQNVDYGIYNIDLRAGTTAAVSDNGEQGQVHRWMNVIVSGNVTNGMIDLKGFFKDVEVLNGSNFANVSGDIDGDFDIKIGNVSNTFTTVNGDISGNINVKIGDVSSNVFVIQTLGDILANIKAVIGNVGTAFATLQTGNINATIDCTLGNANTAVFVNSGNINGNIKLIGNNVNFCFFVTTGGINANVNVEINFSSNHFFRTSLDIAGHIIAKSNEVVNSFNVFGAGSITARIDYTTNVSDSSFMTTNGNISGQIHADLGIANQAFVISGTGNISGNIKAKILTSVIVFSVSSSGVISGNFEVDMGVAATSSFTSVSGSMTGTITNSNIEFLSAPFSGYAKNTVIRSGELLVEDGAIVERCKILGDDGTNSIIGTTSSAQIIYTATKEPISGTVTGLLSNNLVSSLLV
jgi:hypothetical protein